MGLVWGHILGVATRMCFSTKHNIVYEVWRVIKSVSYSLFAVLFQGYAN